MATIIADRRITHKKVESNLQCIKDRIGSFRDYFSDNYARFNEFRKFVFYTSLSDSDISLMKELGKPQLEFNVLEAYLSRLRGEFSKQEPSVIVRASDDAKHIDTQLIDLLESHARAVISDTDTDNLQYDVYTDLLSGGFSAIKVYTDYVNEMSFNQNIYIRRVFDPTLTGFDKMARTSHKGDGMYCFELFPKSKEEFEAEYGKKMTEKMKFSREIEGFSWSYTTDKEEVVMIGDFYEKKMKKAKIVQLITGQVMTVTDYEKLIADWAERTDMIIQPPGVVGKPRETEITTICRSRIVENDTIEYVETDYKYLPIVFIDGNSIMLRDSINGTAKQMTRPYIYHAKGIQKLKNFAGICLANELENTVQHKWSAPKEGIPPEYKDAYINVQKAQVLVYNAFKDNDPNIPLPKPEAVPRIPAPPEITNTFTLSDEVTQAILGSYDASLGINNNQLSGVAIVEGATQSNSAAMPYIVGFMKGLTQAMKVYLDLFPKYNMTARNIPVKDVKGQRNYAMINAPGSPQVSYNSNELDVKIEAGVNFEIQKSRALDTLKGLMQVSPIFAEFMTQEAGLDALLDNIDIRGVDGIKQDVKMFVQKIEQQKQQQMKMQQQQMMMEQQNMAQNNPIEVMKADIAQKMENNERKAQLEAAKIAVSKEEADTKRILALATIGEKADKIILESDKIQAEDARSAVDYAIQSTMHHHSAAMDLLNLHSNRESARRESMHG